AADLGPGDPHFTTITLKHAGRRKVGFGKERIGGTTGEQSDASSPLSFGRQQLWQTAMVRAEAGHHFVALAQRRRQYACQAELMDDAVKPGSLKESMKTDQPTHAPGIWRHVKKHQALQYR